MIDGAVLTVETKFEVIYCCSCRIAFAVPNSVRSDWREKGTTFWCPNGHQQHYSESDVQKLRKALEIEQRNAKFARENAAAERQAREQTERRLSARKAANTRLRNRVKNGVCPCCNRTFMNLHDHMKTKHPDFQPDDKE